VKLVIDNFFKIHKQDLSPLEWWPLEPSATRTMPGEEDTSGVGTSREAEDPHSHKERLQL
jgi:hypothetical protein